MKKFLVSVVPVLVVLSMLLTACGGGAATQPTSAPVATTAPAATAAPEPTKAPAATTAPEPTKAPEATTASTGASGGTAGTLPSNCTNVALNYWNPFTGPDGPFMGQMVDAFNKANPNIKVTMTSQAEYYTQLQTAAAADQLPDVAIVHADQIATQVYRNILRPIDDMVKTMNLSGADYPAPVWAAGEVNGKRYSIPLDIHPMTMFYNNDMLKAAGIAAPPKTPQEFEAAAAKLTSGDKKGFDITGGFPVQQIFQMLLHQFGGTEFSEDGTKVTWNSDAGVKALQWMKDAQSKYSEPNLEVDAELNAFKAGNVAMVWNGIWQTSNVTGKGVEFAGMATAVPQIGDKMAVWAGSHQLTLPTHKNADACKDAAAAMFIRYVVDNSVTWAKGGQIPANNKVRSSAEFKAVEPQASIAPSVESAFFPPSVPGITDAFGPLGEAVGSVMNGTATDIKKTLDDSAMRAEEILVQNKATYGSAPKQ